VINLAGATNAACAAAPISARAIFADGRSAIDCQIKNFSITGARLALGELIVLPDRFLLEVPHRNKTYRTELRSKSRDAAGVKFLEEVGASPASASIEQLQEEIALLRGLNAEMRARLRCWDAPSGPTSPRSSVGRGPATASKRL
jgi:hypothetical protein